jgi:hypothetical protein
LNTICCIDRRNQYFSGWTHFHRHLLSHQGKDLFMGRSDTGKVTSVMAQKSKIGRDIRQSHSADVLWNSVGYLTTYARFAQRARSRGEMVKHAQPLTTSTLAKAA